MSPLRASRSKVATRRREVDVPAQRELGVAPLEGFEVREIDRQPLPVVAAVRAAVDRVGRGRVARDRAELAGEQRGLTVGLVGEAAELGAERRVGDLRRRGAAAGLATRRASR